MMNMAEVTASVAHLVTRSPIRTQLDVGWQSMASDHLQTDNRQPRPRRPL